MSEHMDKLDFAIRGLRGFMHLLGSVDEKGFQPKADEIYWLLHPLLLDLHYCLDEMEKERRDAGMEVLQAKWEKEKQELQEKQWAESRAYIAITHPDLPMAPVYKRELAASSTVDEVRDILRQANQNPKSDEAAP